MPTRTSPDEIVAAFGHVAAAIVSGAERDEVLAAIVAALRPLVDGDTVALALRLPDGNLEVLAAEGVDADMYRGARFEPTGTETDRVMRTGETVGVKNLSANYADNPPMPGGNPGPAVFVPVRVDGPDGALAVMRLKGREDFGEEERQLIRAFTEQTTAMLEGDLDRRRDAMLERINEQARIAAELNSSAINELYDAGLTLSRLYNHARDVETRRLVLRAIEVLDGTIKMIRQAVFGQNESVS
jgi:GAF domain-containing protein